VFLGGQPRQLPKGAELQRPQKFRDPYVRSKGLTWSDQIWWVTPRNRQRLSMVSDNTPRFKGGRPSVPQISGTYTCAHTVWKTTNFCMVIKLDVREIFTLSTTKADAQSDCSS